MAAVVDLQIASDHESIPDLRHFELWLDTVLTHLTIDSGEMTVRVVDEAESRSLNHDYRSKDKPTNVLSFPFDAPPGIELDLLGDLVVCAPVVAAEAEQQNKALIDHWAHMTIHGTLHLLGYDHIEEQDAEAMESLEIELLRQLAIDDPYCIRE